MCAQTYTSTHTFFQKIFLEYFRNKLFLYNAFDFFFKKHVSKKSSKDVG